MAALKCFIFVALFVTVLIGFCRVARALELLQSGGRDFNPVLTASWISPRYSRVQLLTVTLVNSQLVCLRPVGILNLVGRTENYWFTSNCATPIIISGYDGTQKRDPKHWLMLHYSPSLGLKDNVRNRKSM